MELPASRANMQRTSERKLGWVEQPAAATGGMEPATATGGLEPAAAEGGLEPAAAEGGLEPAAAQHETRTRRRQILGLSH